MSDAKKSNEPDGDAKEEQLADLAAFVLAGRPERVEDGVLMLAPAEYRAAVRDAREVLSVFGRAEPPKAPPVAVVPWRQRGFLCKSIGFLTSQEIRPQTCLAYLQRPT